MSSDIRQQLLAAKKDIEEKSGGFKFSFESLALADLTSEFVAIKVADKINSIADKIKAEVPPSAQPTPTLGTPGEGVKDLLYGE